MDLYYHWKFREGKIFPLLFYAPAFHTSEVTQCLNSFADESLLLRIRAYSPDSLMMVICCAPEGVSNLEIPLSSSNTLFLTASVGLQYPSAVATSFPTNHGSPEISTVLISPNSGWLNTVGAICESTSERWGSILIPHHYVHFSKDVDSFYSLNVFPPHTKGMSTCDTSSFAMKGEWEMHNFSHSKLYKILLTLFEHISQKSISVSRGTLSQPCQRNKSSGCILNQTYYFACNNTFI